MIIKEDLKRLEYEKRLAAASLDSEGKPLLTTSTTGPLSCHETHSTQPSLAMEYQFKYQSMDKDRDAH